MRLNLVSDLDEVVHEEEGLSLSCHIIKVIVLIVESHMECICEVDLEPKLVEKETLVIVLEVILGKVFLRHVIRSMIVFRLKYLYLSTFIA